jgi:hypothetical protein
LAELPKFCSAAHRSRFHRRRASLSTAIEALEQELGLTMLTPRRRRLERELQWLRWLAESQYSESV